MRAGAGFSADRSPELKTTLLVLTAAAVAVILVGWLSIRQWAELGVVVSPLGWLAYALGGVFSLLLAAGLFYALFQSSRRGYDDIDRPED